MEILKIDLKENKLLDCKPLFKAAKQTLLTIIFYINRSKALST